MALEDLTFKIKADTADPMAALKNMNSALTVSSKNFGEVETSLRNVTTQATKLGNTNLRLNLSSGASAVADLERIQTNVSNVSSAAANAQFSLSGLSKSLTLVSYAAKPLELLGGKFRVITHTTSLAAGGAAQVAAAFGLASTMATYLAAGIGLVIAPLRGLLIIPKMIAFSFGVMFAAILAPFKVLIGLVTMAYKAVMLLAGPFITLAKIAFHIKMGLSGLQIQFALLRKVLEFLPPKIRMVVIGLVALGAAGRVGQWAVGVLSFGLRQMYTAVLLLTNPLQALRRFAMDAAKGIYSLATSAIAATRALARMAATQTVAGLKNLASSVGSVAGMIGGKLLSSAKMAVQTFTLLAVASVGWGVALAADAEQAQIGFQTMLKSADAAKAVLNELEQFAASTPFQLDSLRDGAKQLLNAQVPASDLTNKLRMLGDIAAGTGKPIEDFVRIFAKVKSTGKVSLETLNQLAERGVPIYTALQQQLGVSREEMLKMISSGEVGFDDMNASLEGLTTGAGVFAGGMAAQSLTLSGLWSTLKDNLSFAVREIGVNVANAFDFKGLMTRGIELFQRIKSGIADWLPVFRAVALVAQSAFGAVWEIVTVTFASIQSALGLTSGDWQATFVTWAATASWAFENWPDIMELAFIKTQLALVSAGNDFVHLFTGVLPALLDWFGSNWSNVFTDAANLVVTVFGNIATNIMSVMSGIWDYIASGGTASLKVAFVPLMEGFESTIKTLPNIPERAVTALEKQLTADSVRLGDALGESLAQKIDANLKMLDDFRAEQAATIQPTLAGAGGPDAQASESTPAADAASKRAAENKAISTNSSEGQSVVAQFLRGFQSNDPAKATATNTGKMATALANIERETRGSKRITSRRI